MGDADGGVARLAHQLNHVGQGLLGREVGVADYEAGLELLHLTHHLGLTLDGL